MKKRLTSALTAFALIMGAAIPALAAEGETVIGGADVPTEITVTESGALSSEELTSAVKGKLDIPSEYDEFALDSSTDSDGTVTYRLSWSMHTDGAWGEISAAADDKGHILSYNNSDSRRTSFSGVVEDSRADVIAQMLGKVKTMLPDCFAEDDTYSVEQSSFNTNGRGMAIFQRYRGGIKVRNNSISVNFEKTDGGYVITSLTSDHDYDAQFGENTPDGVDIAESYKELAEGRMEYNLIYDYDEGAYRSMRIPVLRYVIDNAPFMDPATGNEIAEDDDDRVYLENSSSGGGAVSDSTASGTPPRAELTEEELAELEKLDTLMTADEIKAALAEAPEFNVTPEMTVQSERVYKDTDADKYYMTLTLSADSGEDSGLACRVTVNAENGKLTSFYDYTSADYSDERKVLTEEELAEAPSGTAILEKYADDFDNFALDEKTGERRGSTFITETYYRLVNGIPFTGSSASIQFNANNNTVTYLDISESLPDSEFPDPADAVSEDTAFETMTEAYPVEEVYVKSDGIYKKAYTLSVNRGYVDAIKNIAVNSWDNEPIEKDGGVYTYDDISGHWAEDMINQLAQFGIGFDGDKFRPDEYITSGDFAELAQSIVRIDGSGSVPMATTLGIYEQLESSKEMPVTREKAVTAIIKYAGYAKVAALEGIFVTGFDDEDQISPECLGSCAIAKGLGIVNGDGGNFDPQRHMTRAEAVAMLYKYMINR